jgi:hypothetical protein
MADESTVTEPVAARYARPSEFLSGVPARDLTESEWQALTDAQRAACIESGLYIAVGASQPARRAATRATKE